MRAAKPIVFVDAYYDHAGQALCPAATGISHHINPWGGIEPCPIVQFVTDSIHDEQKSLKEKFNSPYLKAFRELAADTTRGCIVLERPDLLANLVDDESATDGTVRGTAMAELNAMQVRPSQYSPDPATAVPEKSWAYRIAKRLFFNDFGTYNGRDHSQGVGPGDDRTGGGQCAVGAGRRGIAGLERNVAGPTDRTRQSCGTFVSARGRRRRSLPPIRACAYHGQ